MSSLMRKVTETPGVQGLREQNARVPTFLEGEPLTAYIEKDTARVTVFSRSSLAEKPSRTAAVGAGVVVCWRCLHVPFFGSPALSVTRWVELGLTLFTALIGVVVMFGSVEQGIGWGDTGPEPGLLPPSASAAAVERRQPAR